MSVPSSVRLHKLCNVEVVQQTYTINKKLTNMDQDLFIDIPVKSHGCLCPFHPMQIASYFLFSFHAYVFYFVELVSLQQLGRAVYVLVAPYTLLFLSVISLGIVITLSDPTDPTVYSERLRLQRK